MVIDSIKRAYDLRQTLKKDDKILVVDFSGTLQGKDTSKVIELMPNINTNEFIFRTKINTKPIDPIAAEIYRKEYFDVSQNREKDIEEIIKKDEFDFPLWFKHEKNFNMRQVLDYNSPFIIQVAGCNFHDGSSTGGCWYCFVDDKSNNGIIEGGKTFLSVKDTIESMLYARKKINEQYKKYNKDVNIKVIRTSGGEPTIVLDWILDLWNNISRQNLDFVGQIDTNLSTGAIIDDFEKKGIFEKNILEKLAEHPVKILAAIKGVDWKNLQNNVQSSATIEEQKYSLIKIIKAGLDAYIPAYNPNPNTLENYLAEMDKIIENFSLRVHIGPLKVYGPTIQRITLEARNKGINPEDLIEKYKSEWNSNYKKSCEVIDSYLRKNYNIGYKETTRSDVKLKVRS